MLRRLWRQLDLSSRAAAVLGINARNRHWVYPHNPRPVFPLANDKVLCKEHLLAAGVPVPALLHVFRDMREAGRASELLSAQGLEEFVLKPAQGMAGNGILVVSGRTPSGWQLSGGELLGFRRLDRHVAGILFGNYANGMSDRALVEERLQQATLVGPEMPGLPDIRIIAFRGEVVMAMLRLPTLASRGKANLHQGAVAVGLDLDSGRTLHASHHGRPIVLHPDLGCELVGRQLPAWTETLDVARRAAAAVPLGYLGVDISLDRRHGPVVLEVNARPGLEIQNANRRGLRRPLEGSTSGVRA